MKTALITGGSRGLGRALAIELAIRGWHLILDARNGPALLDVADTVARHATVDAISGSVRDPQHRRALADAVARAGALDLLVNNASSLGASPQPRLGGITDDQLHEVFDTNVVSPLALFAAVAADMERARGIVVNISSDAGVEAYDGWGAYGASKAALDHASRTIAVEHPKLAVYAFDPGDMNTAMHQDAFPGEDISDRPRPETVVPALIRLVESRPPSGRYRTGDVLAEAVR